MRLGKRVGRMPRSVVLALLLFLWTAWVGIGHLGSADLARQWGLLLGAELLLVALGLHRHRQRAWRCAACGHRSPPRTLPAGGPSPAVAIPTFNNRDAIAGVIDAVIEAAPDLPLFVVDDGSTDGTGDVAAAALAAHAGRPSAPERAVLRHRKNRGKGAALDTALRRAFHAGCSHLVTLDGDGQHHGGDVRTLRAALVEHPGAIIVGSRNLSDANVESISRFGRNFSNFWLRVLSGARLADSQSGMRAYPTAPVLSLGLRARRYDWEVEVLTLGARAGIPLRSVPVRVHYPPPAERVSHFDKLWDNARISWINTRILCATPLWILGWPARFDRGAPPSNIVRPWTGRSLGGRAGHAAFYWILRLFGRRPAYAMLYPVCLYYILAHRRRTRATLPLLDRVVGPTGPVGRFVRTFRVTLAFARTILDRMIIHALGPSGVEFESEGREYIENIISNGRGVILLSAHVGSNAIAGLILSSGRVEGYEVNLVMLDADAEAVKRVYERVGAKDRMPKIIAINKGQFPALRILEALRKGEVVAIEADRPVDEHWAWADFLGTPAPFPTGPYAIAAAAKVPVVATFAFAEGPGRYRFTAEPPREIVLPRPGRDDALREHAAWFAAHLETHARRYPYQWYNFYDFWTAPAAPGDEDEAS